MVKTKITYRPYPLKKIMTVNELKFDTIIISSHYEENHSYMNDEKILEITKQLDKKDDFIPHRQGKLPNGVEWQNFFWEPFFDENKAYRLVWYWEIGKKHLWILNCFRRKKYEKNK
ncbi:MAG: hypothetical protein GBAus27B_000201 [Mycoplasmataceae bacterium]|nr:MAG: hypothetical protein GBAus27B_000201 [Mycoplasmataceae bacterium]